MSNVHPISEARSLRGLDSTEDIIADIKAGKMVVIMDDEDRENEGDLIMAASHCRPEDINFMARFGRGLICLTLTAERCRQLRLPPMVAYGDDLHQTAFTVSIEASQGVTTGISAADRAVTVRAAVKPDARPEDLVQPGHIFPLMAQPGGVLTRAGHTEAGCDLARLAGVEPASVIVEILNDDGTMARRPDLEIFAREHGLKIGTIADLIHYRSQTESLVRRVAERDINTAHGRFRAIAYLDRAGGASHVALVHGQIGAEADTLVRVHEPLSIMDLLDTGPGSHSWSVDSALRTIAAAGAGVPGWPTSMWITAGVLSFVFLRRNSGSATTLARRVLSGWL